MQYSLNYSGTRFLSTNKLKLLNFLKGSVLTCNNNKHIHDMFDKYKNC